jgi:hypothetical protein
MDILQATILIFGERCDGLVKENIKLKSENDGLKSKNEELDKQKEVLKSNIVDLTFELCEFD